jgi:predicted ribosomally synthesized peptide with SipW-like signal peptide
MTNTNKLDISRRKVLGGLGTVGIASAGAGLGTSAFFSDTENFDGNSMVAGELDLKMDWEEHYSDWMGDETDFASMDDDGSLVIEDQDGFMNATLVEAFPDESDDGEQDFTGEEPCSDDSNLADGDLPDALESDLRTEGTLNGQTTESGDPLINLDDVKPGDKGEVTFSLHLCDNPGYIWLTGDLTENVDGSNTEPELEDSDEPQGDEGDGTIDSDTEGELADEIMVQAWYDSDCDNVFDEDESVIFASGSLSSIMDGLANGGVRLDASRYGASDDGTGAEASDECNELGKLEWGEFDGVYQFRPENGSVVHDADGAVGDILKLDAVDGSGNWANIEIQFIEYKDDDETEPIRVEWEIVDSTDVDGDGDGDIGICALDVKAANDTKRLYEGELCITGAENTGTESFVNEGGQQPAISNIQFDYCVIGGGGAGGQEEDGVCFDPNTKYCIGFDWRLPVDHANEIQGDSVGFDLGFYTEQCRHNDGSGGPS